MHFYPQSEACYTKFRNSFVSSLYLQIALLYVSFCNSWLGSVVISRSRNSPRADGFVRYCVVLSWTRQNFGVILHVKIIVFRKQLFINAISVGYTSCTHYMSGCNNGRRACEASHVQTEHNTPTETWNPARILISVIYFTTLSVAETVLYRSEDDSLIMYWEGHGRNLSWPNLRYHSGIGLE
jgi:hypothetical protein